MHASIEQLLTLRDGGSVPPQVSGHVRDCPECKAEVDRLAAVRGALLALPAFAPPAAAWERILDRSAGPAAAPRGGQRWMLAGLAAALVVAVVLRPAFFKVGPAGESAPAVPGVAPVAAVAGGQPIMPPARPDEVPMESLVERSRQLEAMLTMLATGRGVMNAATAGTIATLEDRLAMVDYRLNEAAGEALPPERTHDLWQHRVDLMDSLVTVRYAQLRRDDF